MKFNKSFDATILNFIATPVPIFLSPPFKIADRVGSLQSFHVKIDVKHTPLQEMLYQIDNDVLDITLIPSSGEWQSADAAFQKGDDRYDLVIVLGCSDLNVLGELSEIERTFLQRVDVINIDHHADNEQWGNINHLDLHACSTTETIYHWLRTWKSEVIDGEMATTILAGMMAETRAFRRGRLSPRSLQVSSDLLARGAKRDEIVQDLWRTRPLEALKLWGRVLTRLEEDKSSGLIWARLSNQDILETGSSLEAVDGVVEELINYAPEARVTMVMVDQPPNVAVTIYAQSPVSAIELIRSLGGSGTRERAWLLLPHNDIITVNQELTTRLKTLLHLLYPLTALPLSAER